MAMALIIVGFILAHVLCFFYAIRVLRTQRSGAFGSKTERSRL